MVNAPEATNTLIVVPRGPWEASAAPALFAALHQVFARQGRLRVWAPLHGLGRAVVVFADDVEALQAKAALDKSLVEERSNAEGGDEGEAKQCVLSH
jgi:hypothetical protein